MKVSVLESFVRHGVRLVVLFVFASGMACVCMAQAAGAAAQPAPKVAVPAAKPAMTTLAAQAELPAAQAERQRGGNHEGIQVHGHWIIEVKNPDGTVTARREFENSIQQYGMAYLASLLAGNNSPGGLSVLLNGAANTPYVGGAAIPAFLNFAEAGPCVPMSLGASGAQDSTGGPASGTTCLLTTGPNASGIVSLLGFYCYDFQVNYNTANKIGTSGAPPPAGQTFPCSTNLTESAPTFTAAGTVTGVPSAQLQISGSVTATGYGAATPTCAAGNICDVETVFTTCAASNTPSDCVGGATTQGGFPSGLIPDANDVFTARNLDGLNGDPPAVPYATGQTIAVSVTISFQ